MQSRYDKSKVMVTAPWCYICIIELYFINIYIICFQFKLKMLFEADVSVIIVSVCIHLKAVHAIYISAPTYVTNTIETLSQ